MVSQIKLGEIVADVTRKDIKNVHLSVYPPRGKVRISAPLRMSLDTIRIFAITKLGWIKSQQKKLQAQERETAREYIERESHFVWGKRYLFSVREAEQAPSIELKHNRMILRVRPSSDIAKKQEVIEEWYRDQIRNVAPSIITKWEPILRVKVNHLFVQRMKTRWGSCNSKKRNIRLNTDLAKKPRECIEYIVVHEMVHLLEKKHDKHFQNLMENYLPKWRFYRQELNRLPIRNEKWEY